jgi:hypothetical protein
LVASSQEKFPDALVEEAFLFKYIESLKESISIVSGPVLNSKASASWKRSGYARGSLAIETKQSDVYKFWG